MESVAHTLILGEHTAKVNGQDLHVLMEAQEIRRKAASLPVWLGTGQHQHSGPNIARFGGFHSQRRAPYCLVMYLAERTGLNGQKRCYHHACE